MTAITGTQSAFRDALHGIAGILVTPYEGDEVAPTRLQPIVDRAIASGIHTLVTNGDTSEFYALTSTETERMVWAAADIVGSRVPLIAGVGRNVKEAHALLNSGSLQSSA